MEVMGALRRRRKSEAAASGSQYADGMDWKSGDAMGDLGVVGWAALSSKQCNKGFLRVGNRLAGSPNRWEQPLSRKSSRNRSRVVNDIGDDRMRWRTS